MNNGKYKRDFKGIWIPKEVWLDDNLNITEKVLLLEIDSLDNEKGCFAKNKHFADFLKVSENYISKSISKLKKDGYIYQEKFNGRQRVLRSNFKFLSKAALENSQKQTWTEGNSNQHINLTGSKTDKPSNNTVNNTVNKNTTISKSENIPHQKIKDLYNSICKSLDEIKLITGKRRDKIQTRWKELKVICEDGQTPLDLIETIFKKVEASDFLTNRRKSSNPKYQDFKVDFNWIFDNDTNYVKVLEGKYDNKDNDNRNNYDKKSAEERRQKILEAQRKRFQRDD